MRILLSNDDGFDAPGMEVLKRIAYSLSDEVVIVAPAKEQSGASRSLTLHDPLRVNKYSETEYSVEGTPTDCVMMALNYLFPDDKPDLILSGVNRGANLGEDVLYSGTVAAASEGTLLGVPSIALSMCMFDSPEIHWETAEKMAPGIIRKLLETGWGEDTLVNINFPAIPVDEVQGVVVTRQGKRDLSNLLIDARVDARGREYYWLGYRPSSGKPFEGSDLHAVENKMVSVTPLKLNLTNESSLDNLAKALG
ncbi:5'/3'-nucleotidase SurE [Sneathiella chinensis]|uniref:5'-nucleotidase SurE n=1 Tax=Sneathiella chinensis TaxID=349750 RepID=A0ABQ5U6C2_9PROT|nr:5'/3'-nucleotidase SurE [Sneathiella chinensis]GLQ07469.1 5'-nucleotidase SurE [Sneathiella chinensis]